MNQICQRTSFRFNRTILVRGLLLNLILWRLLRKFCGPAYFGQRIRNEVKLLHIKRKDVLRKATTVMLCTPFVESITLRPGVLLSGIGNQTSFRKIARCSFFMPRSVPRTRFVLHSQTNWILFFRDDGKK